MKLLLLGANGQVGWELQRSLAPLGELIVCDRHSADLTQLSPLSALIETQQPDVIVNAAAYTAVDQAEQDVDNAFLINAEAVGLLACKAAQLGSYLVHYSTDYVFDGTKSGAYQESDAVNPQSVYGKSKLKGEQLIAASGCNHLIFRTSWVFARRGQNFAKTMLKLAAEKDSLQVVADQYGAPTSAEMIADITALCLYKATQLSKESMLPDKFLENLSGIYHLAAAGETNWHGYAQYLIEKASSLGFATRVSVEDIQAVSTENFPRPAPRPANSVMNTSKLSSTFDITLPDWRCYVDRLLDELFPGY
ncbi:dTDP-4-dehydrorhamnose reductase [Methylophaga lonarensis]|uniref:dTDP-4-dehydrorhamnose reductase n=1 Tax=Methylophaga lonarensis TaxID=999151 RepID=UPI003D290E4B